MAERPSTAAAGGLALGLLRASDALNDALLDRLAARGGPSLTRNQTLVFAHIDSGGTPPATLARRIGITRQSMQVLLATLADLGLVITVAHPADRRAVLVQLTGDGRRLVRTARRELQKLERRLADEFGAEDMAVIAEAVGRDWRPLLA